MTSAEHLSAMYTSACVNNTVSLLSILHEAVLGVQACYGSLERAADWLFSHADDLDSAVASVSSSASQQAPAAGSQGELARQAQDLPWLMLPLFCLCRCSFDEMEAAAAVWLLSILYMFILATLHID